MVNILEAKVRNVTFDGAGGGTESRYPSTLHFLAWYINMFKRIVLQVDINITIRLLYFSNT